MRGLYQFIVGFATLQLISAQCLQCTSREIGQGCIDPEGTVLGRFCPTSGGNIRCYSRVVNGDTIRGCASDLEIDVQTNCNNDTGTDGCYVCDRPNCNLGRFPINRLACHSCDEKELYGTGDRNCSLAIVGVPQPCTRYSRDERCITRKAGDLVIRQCLSDYDDCKKEKGCQICDSHGCNNKEYNSAVSLSIHNTVVFTGLAYFLSKLF